VFWAHISSCPMPTEGYCSGYKEIRVRNSTSYYRPYLVVLWHSVKHRDNFLSQLIHLLKAFAPPTSPLKLHFFHTAYTSLSYDSPCRHLLFVLSLSYPGLTFYARLHKMQKATIGFVMYVGPDVRIKISIPTGRIFMKYNLRILRNTIENNQIRLKPCNITGNLLYEQNTLLITSCSIIVRTRNVNFFPKSCRLWNNVENYGTATQATDDNNIQRRKDANSLPGSFGKNAHAH
jgi:hypothetical protein